MLYILVYSMLVCYVLACPRFVYYVLVCSGLVYHILVYFKCQYTMCHAVLCISMLNTVPVLELGCYVVGGMYRALVIVWCVVCECGRRKSERSKREGSVFVELFLAVQGQG
ncbi:hypothetical protein B0T24DRAFT_620456 [Lasiosphaeria ovina]|uniref:Uncharacterized protein n=1 Tax=Lasiosphaeria ovina TaxID=92902 RepID=A0AAE0NC20_9PEZI|nr:hypothetical protein B0T24DRAFT_620456 [Lasiosphaeria ovina]